MHLLSHKQQSQSKPKKHTKEYILQQHKLNNSYCATKSNRFKYMKLAIGYQSHNPIPLAQ